MEAGASRLWAPRLARAGRAISASIQMGILHTHRIQGDFPNESAMVSPLLPMRTRGVLAGGIASGLIQLSPALPSCTRLYAPPEGE